MLNNSEFLRTFAAGMLLRSGAAFLTALALRASAVLLMVNEATRFCLVHSNLENSISKQDRVRRFTYIRGLVVSWSFCKVFQNRSVEIVGYAGPRFVFILDSMAQVYRYISIGLCHL